ncbi:MAG: TetR/AcrR family transcriptional regulator [Clostridia bacterium]|nr:TetR/AcrR family transcriptional regulator [Clostridia bacterium]
MPNKTFLNLPIEKQEEIIEISLQVFCKHDYESASLNEIISKLGIAKGSFYRYFDTKSELYSYLIEYSVRKKSAYIDEHVDLTTTDVFELFKNTMFHHLKFDLIYPIYGKFLLQVFTQDNLRRQAFSKHLKAPSIIRGLIIRAQNEETLRKDMDVDFIMHCMFRAATGLDDYMAEMTGINHKRLIDEAADLDINDDELMSIFDMLVKFLKHGFLTKQ